MKKLYYAYVTIDMLCHFEEKLAELKDEIEVVDMKPAVSEDCKPLVYYELKAEEGIIDPKWELK